MSATLFRWIAAFVCAVNASWLVFCAPAMAQSSSPSASQYSSEISQNEVNAYDGVDAGVS